VVNVEAIVIIIVFISANP